MTFAFSLEGFGDQVALQFEDDSRISYLGLAEIADRIFLHEGAPIKPRTLIAIECENSLASIAGYIGALRHDFPALLVDGILDQELRERLYWYFKISKVWSVDATWQSLKPISPSVHPDVAIMLSTSGSTGAPKLVCLSQANLRANAESISEYLALTPEERPITTLPIHYSYGLSVLNSHLITGGTILVTRESITSRKFWEFFRTYKASSFAGVPTHYEILKQLRFERMNLPFLRTMTQAGGHLSPDLIRWFAELCKEKERYFFVMYGQTEATARISYVPPHRLTEKIGSIGIPIPGGTIRLVGAQGEEITEAGIKGELCYIGPNVMMGYAKCVDDLSLPDVLKVTLYTGDLAWKDSDGFYYIAGRLKRFIKIFGNRIQLDEIEMQLREDGYETAVTGQDDLLVVAIRTSRINKEVKATLLSHLRYRYRIYHTAVQIIFVEEFPLSSTGKIQYPALLKMAKLAPEA